jgi:hypothetical protein
LELLSSKALFLLLILSGRLARGSVEVGRGRIGFLYGPDVRLRGDDGEAGEGDDGTAEDEDNA